MLVLSVELVFLFLGQVLAVEEALVGGLRGRVVAAGFGAVAGFAEQLQGGAEEIVQPTPGAIELIDGWEQLGAFQALIAQELADMGSVFLFDMSLVVLLVGAAAGHGNGPGPIQQIAPQVEGQELRTVVHLKAQNGEG